MLFSSVISFLGLASAAFASLDSHVARRNHTELVARQAGVVRGAVASYYKINTGNQVACGGFYQPGDYVVAMNGPMFGGACGKKIVIEYRGKRATATIVDLCPGCIKNSRGGLDLTEGLFSYFAPHSVGLITLNWWFVGQGPPAGNDRPAPPPAPRPSRTPRPRPTPSREVERPSPPPSRTRTRTRTTTSTTSTSSSSREEEARPTPPATPQIDNINGSYDAVAAIAQIVMRLARNPGE